jgi:lipopolysaccharide transport system ATP-binding protein
MMDAIVVSNVSKTFRIPHEKKTTLLQNIIGVVKRQFEYEKFSVLNDISFRVGLGETFGVIGKNGSGKTTLLKILSRVLYPDSGSVSISNKVAPFLELGVGFQPDLTAAENVFIYSSILGLSRRDVKKVYDEIFDFGELRRFENMKLKNFSSGMYMRLAFSTAIHANPDILLIDEVFAVGDAAFMVKCEHKMNEIQKQGKTIVLVTHDLNKVKNLCKRSMLLNEGRISSIGTTDKVVEDYLAILHGAQSDA